MAGRPLDQLDSVSVRVCDPGRPEILGTIGRGWWFNANSPTAKLGKCPLHGVDHKDEVAEPAGADHFLAWIVDEFEGHELVPGQLEHGEAADRRLGNLSEHLISDALVELE